LAGFTSEWLIYRGLIDGGLGPAIGAGPVLWMLAAITALAGVGVLAALCFVRVVGIALLGQPRSEAAARAHEPGPGVVVPLGVLAAGVVAMPLVAPRLIAALGPAIDQIAHAPLPTAAAHDALTPILWLCAALWAALAAGWLAMRRLVAHARGD